MTCLASGQKGDAEVSYYHAQDVHSSQLFLLQISISSSNLRMSMIMKAKDQAVLPNFAALFRALLTPKDRGGLRWLALG